MQNSQNPLDSLDFDGWAALAKDHPEAFDELKQRYIEEFILEHCRRWETDPRKCRGLQWRIDMEIRKSRTPLKACLRLSSMMWDSFLEMRESLDSFVAESRKHGMEVVSSQPLARLDSASAQVIAFGKRTKAPGAQ